MKRQFVNLVLESCRNSSYTVRPVISSSLFHPKEQNGFSLPPIKLEEAELPKPALSFNLPPPKGRSMKFMPFGLNREKILCADKEGNVLVYDTFQNEVCGMPKLRGWMDNSVSIGLGESLYLIKRCPDKPDQFQPNQRCFQALINGQPPAEDALEFPGWHWHSLPHPPYVEAPAYEPSCTSKMISSTVVCGKIWVSARGIGTYSFDTESCDWSNVSSWDLPFRGAADYIPELGCWLGFSPERENQFLCASDLSTAATNGAVPVLCSIWHEERAADPEKWQPLTSYLVRVDSGRFCVARLYHVHGDDECPYVRENFAVLTGVEVDRCNKADGGIKMV